MTLNANHLCPAVNSEMLRLVASLATGLVISVGSGTGQLEALILEEHPSPTRRVIGVEIASNVNIYLPEENVEVVLGSWDVSPSAKEADTLMFIYPKDPQLLRKYLAVLDNTPRPFLPRSIIWLGPRADWPHYEPVFRAWGNATEETLHCDDGVVARYEKLVVWRET